MERLTFKDNKINNISLKVGFNDHGYWCIAKIDKENKHLRKNGSIQDGTGYTEAPAKINGYFKTTRELLSCINLTFPDFKIISKKSDNISYTYYTLVRKNSHS